MHLLSFGCAQIQVGLITPLHKVLQYRAMVGLFIGEQADTSRIVSKFNYPLYG